MLNLGLKVSPGCMLCMLKLWRRCGPPGAPPPALKPALLQPLAQLLASEPAMLESLACDRSTPAPAPATGATYG